MASSASSTATLSLASPPPKSASNNNGVAADNVSIASSYSQISQCPDRHGFYGGFQFSERPKEVLSRAQIMSREKKWLHMMSNWNTYMNKNYKKVSNNHNLMELLVRIWLFQVRERCRKGIPTSLRSRAWYYLSGAELLHKNQPDRYEELLNEPGDPHIIDEIKKDQHRQFPLHEMFMDEDKPGQKELFNVLKAYSIYNPKVGYCQAQAPIAAFLLMHMPAEQAFWVFVSICDKYLENYFTPGLEMLQRDAQMLHGLLKKTSPPVYRHLQKHKIDPLMYMTDWFLCGLTRTLPWDTLLRVWDCFLCEGIKILFKVALVILGAALGSHKVRKAANGQCETLEVLRNPPPKYLDEDFIMHHMFRLNITVEDLIHEHKRQEQQHRKAAKSPWDEENPACRY